MAGALPEPFTMAAAPRVGGGAPALAGASALPPGGMMPGVGPPLVKWLMLVAPMELDDPLAVPATLVCGLMVCGYTVPATVEPELAVAPPITTPPPPPSESVDACPLES